MKKDKDEKDKDTEKKEEKEDKVELNNVEDIITYYEKEIAKALARGDYTGAFMLYQGVCSAGMGAIKFVVRNPDNGHKKFEKMTPDDRKLLDKFLEETRNELDDLDFDGRDTKAKFDKMIEHYVKDLKQGLNDSVKATQSIFYSNWIDNISNVWSDIKEKLIALGICNLTKVKTRGEIRKEHRAKRLMERLDSHA